MAPATATFRSPTGSAPGSTLTLRVSLAGSTRSSSVGICGVQRHSFYNGQYQEGEFSFTTQFTGDAFADFLLGLPATVGRSYPLTLYGNQAIQWAGFLQDDYRVTNNLTLNLGFRWEYDPFFRGIDSETSAFLPATATGFNTSAVGDVVSRGGIPRRPGGEHADAHLRPGLPALARPALRPGHRWLPITRHGVAVGLGNKWLRLADARRPRAAADAGGLPRRLGPLRAEVDVPHAVPDLLPEPAEELRQGPRGYRTTIWTLAFRQFFEIQLFFPMILVLLAGPDLISQDLRFNAIPLYLSRPVRRFEYFLGKLGVIAAFLSAVTIGPVLLAFAVGYAFSLDPSGGRRHGAGAGGVAGVQRDRGGLGRTADAGASRRSRGTRGMSGRCGWDSGSSARWHRTCCSGRGAEWCPLVSYTRTSTGSAMRCSTRRRPGIG